MATPLQANARPAPIIVIDGHGRPIRLSMYGSMLATPSPTSTSARVRLVEWVLPRAGAVRPAPITPITIAIIATYSRLPGCSPSIRCAAAISTSRPIASAGCTTTSGARASASSCSGKPSIDSPVPASQRARVSSLRTSARRSCSCAGA